MLDKSIDYMLEERYEVTVRMLMTPVMDGSIVIMILIFIRRVF